MNTKTKTPKKQRRQPVLNDVREHLITLRKFFEFYQREAEQNLDYRVKLSKAEKTQAEERRWYNANLVSRVNRIINLFDKVTNTSTPAKEMEARVKRLELALERISVNEEA